MGFTNPSNVSRQTKEVDEITSANRQMGLILRGFHG